MTNKETVCAIIFGCRWQHHNPRKERLSKILRLNKSLQVFKFD